jgi:hypothetical protein
VVVLEGIARTGAVAGITDGVTVPHTPGSCDEMLIAVTADATTQVTLCQPIVRCDNEPRLWEQTRLVPDGSSTCSTGDGEQPGQDAGSCRHETPGVLAERERTRRCRYACRREPERLDRLEAIR